MKLIWNGHSCFTVATENGTVVIDPYRDGTVRGLKPLRVEADAVICTHEHGDHGARENVTLTGKEHSVKIEVLPSFHDNVGGTKRGKNDLFILSAEGFRVAHLGDIGCALTEEQIAALKGVDVLMLPVGGFFSVEPDEAKHMEEQIAPVVTIPMHYRSEAFGHMEIGTLDGYLKYCDDAVYYDSNVFELKPGMKKQTAVLKCPV